MRRSTLPDRRPAARPRWPGDRRFEFLWLHYFPCQALGPVPGRRGLLHLGVGPESAAPWPLGYGPPESVGMAVQAESRAALDSTAASTRWTPSASAKDGVG